MLTKLVRIGKDAELRHTQNGTPILNFSAVYDVGFGDNKKAQWLDCSMFGQRAEKLAQHFTKGKQIVIYANDVCIETWDKNDGNGQGFKLCCKIQDFDFAGSQNGNDGSQNMNQAQSSDSGQAAPDFDDDIPFN